MLAARRAATLTALTLALAAAGCGPVGGEDDEDKVSDTVTELIDARNRGDFETVCDLISAAQQARFSAAGTSCQEALPRIAKEGVTTRIRIDEVRVSGDRATVDAMVSQTGGAGEPQRILLVKEDGDWKVTPSGFSASP